MNVSQCASAVLMVKPARFGYNPETALTNRMAHRTAHAAIAGTAGGAASASTDASATDIAAAARAEFDGLARQLRAAGVAVCVVEDTPEPPKPDAVFPNNWVSFHADGTVVLYPMESPSRRAERRQAVVESACERLGFRMTRRVDLTALESRGHYLEGTGSLVLDHRTRTAYASLSARTHAEALEAWARELDYTPVRFTARDGEGVPYYHTNVMLSVGEHFAVVCSESIDAGDRARVLKALTDSGRELIEINAEQLVGFAGNALELEGTHAGRTRRVTALSANAARVLEGPALEKLRRLTDELVIAPIPTIERIGGGSVRCMLAEVFRPA